MEFLIIKCDLLMRTVSTEQKDPSPCLMLTLLNFCTEASFENQPNKHPPTHIPARKARPQPLFPGPQLCPQPTAVWSAKCCDHGVTVMRKPRKPRKGIKCATQPSNYF